MYAIRVTGKSREADTHRETQFPILDFSFHDLLKAIGAYVSNLYWAHTGIIYSFPKSLRKEDYERINSGIEEYILHSEPDSRIQYMHRGFIEKFGRYIYSDTLDLGGYEDIESLKSFEDDLCDINSTRAYVHFRCSDAVSWEIYTKHLNVIKLIEDAFAFSDILNAG